MAKDYISLYKDKEIGSYEKNEEYHTFKFVDGGSLEIKTSFVETIKNMLDIGEKVKPVYKKLYELFSYLKAKVAGTATNEAKRDRIIDKILATKQNDKPLLWAKTAQNSMISNGFTAFILDNSKIDFFSSLKELEKTSALSKDSVDEKCVGRFLQAKETYKYSLKVERTALEKAMAFSKTFDNEYTYFRLDTNRFGVVKVLNAYLKQVLSAISQSKKDIIKITYDQTIRSFDDKAFYKSLYLENLARPGVLCILCLTYTSINDYPTQAFNILAYENEHNQEREERKNEPKKETAQTPQTSTALVAIPTSHELAVVEEESLPEIPRATDKQIKYLKSLIKWVNQRCRERVIVDYASLTKDEASKLITESKKIQYCYFNYHMDFIPKKYHLSEYSSIV